MKYSSTKMSMQMPSCVQEPIIVVSENKMLHSRMPEVIPELEPVKMWFSEMVSLMKIPVH